MTRALPKFPADRATVSKLDLDDRHPPSNLNSNKPPEPPKASPLQKFVMVSAVLSAVAMVGIPTLLSQQQPRVISIVANDLSASALPDITVARQHCQIAARLLKERDFVVSIEFADRPEVTQAAIVEDVADPLKKCDAIRRDGISPTLGKQRGTDLIALLSEAHLQLKLQRTRGNQYPGVITIWLQNAEPRPGQAALDLKRVQLQIQQITQARSMIVIFGPTGQLRKDLETAIQTNPQVLLCPIASSENCIKEAFDKGRKLP